ncbi:hypothetical protein Q9189_004274 [Teloschistes chrysophthalmus]
MDERSSARAAERKDKPDVKAQVKSADMTDEMQQQAIDVASEAMEKFTIEKDIAQYIKKETKHFIYFYLGHCAILLFKTQ